MNRLLLIVLLFFILINLGLVGYYYFSMSPQVDQTKNRQSNETKSKEIVQISISSNHPKIISARLTDQRYLQGKLDSLGLWNGQKAIFELKKYIVDDIESIQIIITDKEQGFTKVSYDNVITYSTGLELDKSIGNLKMYIHINPVVLTSNTSTETISKSISAQILRRFFSMKYSISNNEDIDYIKDIKPFVKVEFVK